MIYWIRYVLYKVIGWGKFELYIGPFEPPIFQNFKQNPSSSKVSKILKMNKSTV
jgi:hypothetical protein